ncbi:MAG: CAP domain-containing protein, partial [Isosphaeraceae bacterium]
TPDPPAGDMLNRLVMSTNAARSANGRPLLNTNAKLYAVAQIQANFCARNNVLTHVGSKGSTVADRANVVGYAWSSLAENAAQQPTAPPGWTLDDVRTPEWIVGGWMKSPGHRDNLLGPYTEIGAAYADAANGTRYWTAVYASPSHS